MFRGGRQAEVESGFTSRLTMAADRARVGHDNFARNRQAETGAGRFLARHPKESFKDALAKFFGNAGSPIPDGKSHAAILGQRYRKENLIAFWRVFYCVL